MRRLTMAFAAAGIILTAVGVLRADDPNAAYERLYGDEAKKLKSKDTPAFGQRLLADATEVGKDNPALAEVLVAKAAELFTHCSPGADKSALGEALMGRLIPLGDAVRDAGRASDALKIYQQAQRIAGDTDSPQAAVLARRIKQLGAKLQVEKRLAELLKLNKAAPDDANVAKELVLLYVVELDRPADAAPYLPATGEESLRTYVPLAAKDANALETAVNKELGAWYEDLSPKASRVGKIVTCERAAAYYEAFLARQPQKNEAYLAVKKSLESVQKSLEELSLPPGTPKQLAMTVGKNVQLRLVLIPAGKFVMGSPKTEKARHSLETVHQVRISEPFYMGVTEVTQAQYEAVMGKNPCTIKDPEAAVTSISWDDAAEFCKKLSAKARRTVRLPTEAEWEYACRAGTTSAFYYGDDEGKLAEYAWFRDNGDKKPHPVGRKKPNAWGLYDMLGNVWECCSDWYDAKHYDALAAAGGKIVDPQGPATGQDHVLRGGAWDAELDHCRSAFRRGLPPDQPISTNGLRVVVPVD